MDAVTTSTATAAVTTWRLDTANRTAVFASFDNGVPALVHFGTRLNSEERLETIAALSVPNISGGQLDPLVPLSLIPTAMTGWQGHPGFITHAGDPSAVPDLFLRTVDERDDNGLTFVVADRISQAAIEIAIRLYSDSELMSLTVFPLGDMADPFDWLALSIPVPPDMSRIVDHGGRWCGEFQRKESRFGIGQHVRESREGRSGHAHFPGITFMADSASKTDGHCMAVSLCWSGGHKIVAEQLPDGRRHVQLGIANDQPLNAWIRPIEIWLAWSNRGMNDLTHALTGKTRQTLPRKPQRPVHYNCWEAVYFRHNVDELKAIASMAAELGAERFVLDDGWFKGRDDDTTSLGDWVVDDDKFPEGLGPLVDHVRECGMEFGIWFEPEMVNKSSDLYAAHPDWVLGAQHQPAGRNQFVLDLSKPGVSEYLFDAISKIVEDHHVTYIKWDHNRVLTGGTPRQTHELYNLMRRLNDAHPQLEIESCASGGGRIDYGILHYTTRVWLSDSNDALERLRMQHEAGLWLPPEVQGSHVGPRVCHTSGRVFSMGFRAWVAAQRHMGFEMDPRELTEDERRMLRGVTDWYKANRDFLFSARYHRLESNDPEVLAELFVGADKGRFIAFKGQAGTSSAIAASAFLLSGIDADAIYRLRLINPEVVPSTTNRYTGSHLMSGAPIELSGRALMCGALRLPNAFPATMMVVEGERLDHPT
ncbi:MAG: alpha-galactosidase [Pseudomonadota bacterium]